jgi:hypothetical protein
MRTSRVSFTLVIILLFLAIFIWKRSHEPQAREAFDRHPSHLQYTKHALCRMDCRHISEDDIMEIMHDGIINFYNSNRNDKPCPTYALQGETSEGKKLRVIFAQCNKETRVVTCYNLRENFECHCPGD